MKTIITDISTCPRYFKWGSDFVRVISEKQLITRIINFENGDVDINTERFISAYLGEEVEPITKAEFAIELNKAYAKISGFKHIEELWKDEEADTHNTEEIDLLSQCELFIAGVQSYLGDDTTGKELLEKIKNYKK